ncbi:hypothetical protein [Pseudomonas sp. KCJK8993]|uniref:hypothetical protein n=1 Tax=Pseudomonas sp. KCJK8993 TaxID=3344565 RepID=UPI003906B775
MNLSTSSTARHIGLRRIGLALLMLAAAPVAQAFDPAKFKWWEMSSHFALDEPETATDHSEYPGLLNDIAYQAS